MVKVGIVTLDGGTNFGNRLQNFALQEVLRSLGVDSVETLEGLPTGERQRDKIWRLANTGHERRREILPRLGLNATSATSVPDKHIFSTEGRAAVSRFTADRISVVQFDASDRSIADGYDYFVAGSDQIWNPAFTHGNKEWFLGFAHRSQRVAYGGSFGVPTLPRRMRRRFRNGLRSFASLSVREHQAADLVKDLTGVAPPVVLDPTMLLTRATWNTLLDSTVCADPQRVNYVTTFLLARGDVRNDLARLTPRIEAIADARATHVVDIHDLIPDGKFGPLEFAAAIRDSDLVVTDSLHATVFAVIFHRPFLLVPRGNMGSRLDTLLRHIGVPAPMLSGTDTYSRFEEIDWETVDERLSIRRARSMSYLQKALALTG